MKKYRKLFRLIAMFIVTGVCAAMFKLWVAPDFTAAKEELYQRVEDMQEKVAGQREEVFEVGDAMFGEDDLEWQLAKAKSREATSRNIRGQEDADLQKTLAMLQFAKQQQMASADGLLENGQESISFAAMMEQAGLEPGEATEAELKEMLASSGPGNSKKATYTRADGSTVSFDLSLIEDSEFTFVDVPDDPVLAAGIRSSEVEILLEEQSSLSGIYNRLTSNTILYGDPLPFRLIAYEGWERAEKENQLEIVLRHNESIDLRAIGLPRDLKVEEFAEVQIEAAGFRAGGEQEVRRFKTELDGHEWLGHQYSDGKRQMHLFSHSSKRGSFALIFMLPANPNDKHTSIVGRTVRSFRFPADNYYANLRVGDSPRMSRDQVSAAN